MLCDPNALADELALMSLAINRFLTHLPPERYVTAMFVLEADGDIASAPRASAISTSEFHRRLREVRYRLVTIGLADRRALSDI